MPELYFCHAGAEVYAFSQRIGALCVTRDTHIYKPGIEPMEFGIWHVAGKRLSLLRAGRCWNMRSALGAEKVYLWLTPEQ